VILGVQGGVGPVAVSGSEGVDRVSEDGWDDVQVVVRVVVCGGCVAGGGLRG